MLPDISALMSDVTFWESCGYIALSAVVIGVIGESIKEFTPVLKYAGYQGRIGRLSTLLLIAGLAGEGITQPNTNATNARLVAFLNNQTVQLQADLEKERQKTSARVLTEDDWDSIQRLKGKISSVDIAVESGCIECRSLEAQLIFAFRSANIKLEEYRAPPGVSWTGVQIAETKMLPDDPLLNAFIKSPLFGGGGQLQAGAMGILNVPLDKPLILVGEKYIGYARAPYFPAAK